MFKACQQMCDKKTWKKNHPNLQPFNPSGFMGLMASSNMSSRDHPIYHWHLSWKHRSQGMIRNCNLLGKYRRLDTSRSFWPGNPYCFCCLLEGLNGAKHLNLWLQYSLVRNQETKPAKNQLKPKIRFQDESLQDTETGVVEQLKLPPWKWMGWK